MHAVEMPDQCAEMPAIAGLQEQSRQPLPFAEPLKFAPMVKGQYPPFGNIWRRARLAGRVFH
jgi:hypothetical protein